MKDATVNQLVGELEQMFEATGFSATEVLRAMLGVPIPKPYQKLALIGYQSGWKSVFKDQPEPDKAKLAEALTMIRALKSAPHKMRALLKQRIKELPHSPSGPPKKIKAEEELTVCTEIMALRAECDTRQAIQRVAKKWRASERTVYRIWAKYHPKKRKLRVVKDQSKGTLKLKA